MLQHNFKDYIVRIEGSDDKVGSGYLVTNNLVLTCRHVLGDAPRVGNTVQAAWHTHPDESQQAPRSGTVRWIGKGDHDAALVEVEDVPDNLVAGVLWGSSARGGSFESAGFPRVEENVRLVPLSGTVDFHETTSPKISININSEPIDAGDWRGVSGAPVFMDTRIVGIVSDIPDGFAAQTMRGVNVASLLRDEDFGSLVYADLFQEAMDGIKQLAFELFQNQSELLARFREEYALPEFEDANLKAWIHELIDAVSQKGLIRFLKVADTLQVKCRGTNRAAFEASSKFVMGLAPYLMHQRHIREVRAALDSDSLLLSMPLAHPTLFELILAAAMNRPADFHPPAHVKDPDLVRAYNPAVTESQLAPLKTPIDKEQFEDEFHRSMISEFAPDEFHNREPTQEGIRFVNGNLEATHPKEQLFFAVRRTKDNGEICETVLEKLDVTYPSVLFIMLEHGSDTDYTTLQLLSRLVNRRHIVAHPPDLPPEAPNS